MLLKKFDTVNHTLVKRYCSASIRTSNGDLDECDKGSIESGYGMRGCVLLPSNNLEIMIDTSFQGFCTTLYIDIFVDGVLRRTHKSSHSIKAEAKVNVSTRTAWRKIDGNVCFASMLAHQLETAATGTKMISDAAVANIEVHFSVECFPGIMRKRSLKSFDDEPGSPPPPYDSSQTSATHLIRLPTSSKLITRDQVSEARQLCNDLRPGKEPWAIFKFYCRAAKPLERSESSQQSPRVTPQTSEGKTSFSQIQNCFQAEESRLKTPRRNPKADDPESLNLVAGSRSPSRASSIGSQSWKCCVCNKGFDDKEIMLWHRERMHEPDQLPPKQRTQIERLPSALKTPSPSKQDNLKKAVSFETGNSTLLSKSFSNNAHGALREDHIPQTSITTAMEVDEKSDAESEDSISLTRCLQEKEALLKQMREKQNQEEEEERKKLRALKLADLKRRIREVDAELERATVETNVHKRVKVAEKKGDV